METMETTVQVREPRVKTMIGVKSTKAITFDPADGWVLTIGPELASEKKFKTWWQANIYALRNKEKLEDIRMAIIVAELIKRQGKVKKSKNHGKN